jgi:predicted DCC family thiol-disulfide oxidoreductase YuxK
MRSLTVLYDADCAFCQRCAFWIRKQPQYVPIELIPMDSPRAAGIPLPCRAAAGQLTAIDDEGGVYQGNHAYLMVLWAMREYREWSLRMTSPAFWPLARRALDWLTHNRGTLSAFFGGAVRG